MKTNHNGKRYDSNKCETIAHRDHYENGNYAGTTTVERASDGTLLILCDSNGQDFYYHDDFFVPDYPVDLNDYEMDEDEERRAIEYGLITSVD